MIKEELKKEAEEYYEDETEGTFQICEDCYWFADAVQTAYVDSAEPREKQIQIDAEQIRALQKQNGELTDKVRELEEKLKKETAQRIYNFNKSIEWKEKYRELEAQNEKMKCCGNCENGELSAHEEPCLHCQRCFASKDVTDQENVKDNWEVIKEIKEK